MAAKVGSILVLTHQDIATGSGGDVVRAKRISELFSHSWNVRQAGFTRYSPELHPPKLLLLLPSWTVSAAWAVLSGGFDWVYVINDPYLVLLCHFLRKASFRRYRIAYDSCLTHTLLADKGVRTKARETVERLALLRSDLIVTTSERGRRLLGDFRDKLALVPNFVEPEMLQRDEQEGLETRRRYGFGPEDRIVGLIGPFDNMYNRSFLTFLREKASQFDKRIKFLVIGRYNQQDAFARANIVWAGHVQAYPAHLAALDCLLLPRTTPTEGAMNKALEAMAMGLPVFTTPTGHANLESLVPSEHLFVFPEEELPSAMNGLLFDRELMTRVGQRARLQVEQLYSLKAVEQGLLRRMQPAPRCPA